jgi:hypothetical protein
MIGLMGLVAAAIGLLALLCGAGLLGWGAQTADGRVFGAGVGCLLLGLVILLGGLYIAAPGA